MKKVFILVEGQAEETFIKEVFNPYLLEKEILIIPIIVYTSRAANQKKAKGGGRSFGKIENDLSKLLRDTSVSAVTTMFDFYAIATDFPSYDELPAGNCYTRVEFLEQAFARKINDSRFIPYIQLHEFEAMVFVAPEVVSNAFPGTNVASNLEKIKSKYNSPEEIDEGSETAPSKRLIKLISSYSKTVDGPLLVLEIGIDRIRAECPHFDEWLTKLENL
ncbi:MAG: DUF4276 family protein [Chloroflexi bacterium]|nr:DUF4276 family protein [Chloroflexota bacterium]OJW02085.1 MAG: hypothetical protein BGO39_27770 [Chloroflexi bacterium 54-19]